jgi:hypothetical protein
MLAAVRKTPPYLKHLAESRARAAGEVSRRREIVQDAVASLGVSQGELKAAVTEALKSRAPHVVTTFELAQVRSCFFRSPCSQFSDQTQNNRCDMHYMTTGRAVP